MFKQNKNFGWMKKMEQKVKEGGFSSFQTKKHQKLFFGKKEERKKSTKTNQIFFLLTLKNDFQQKKVGDQFYFWS